MLYKTFKSEPHQIFCQAMCVRFDVVQKTHTARTATEIVHTSSIRVYYESARFCMSVCARVCVQTAEPAEVIVGIESSTFQN